MLDKRVAIVTGGTRGIGLEIENDSIELALEPLVLERTKNAPTEVSEDAVADVLLCAMLEVAKICCKDDTLIIGAKVLPDLLLWTNLFHDQKEVLDETLTMS